MFVRPPIGAVHRMHGIWAWCGRRVIGEPLSKWTTRLNRCAVCERNFKAAQVAPDEPGEIMRTRRRYNQKEKGKR